MVAALLGLLSGQQLMAEDEAVPAQIKQLIEIQSDRPGLLEFDDRTHNGKQIVEENGFKYEEFEVETDDGYLLNLQHIKPKKEGAPVVLMVHGVEASSDSWVLNSPDLAPAFILQRAGYDVYMGNNRGNHYSQKHVKYNTS